MNESYDLENHLLIIVFYWHLLRIWHQPPPPDRDDKTAGKQAPTGQAQQLAGVALHQLAAPSADAAAERIPAPAVLPRGPLATIRAADEGFDEKSFLAGAALAYELVVNAYAEEDTNVLDGLLDPQVAAVFANAIFARKARGERIAFTFIGIDQMEIVNAWMEADLAQISVRFTSQAVAATYAPNGTIIEGDPEKVVQMADRWAFARCLTSRDPNWKLVVTECG